MILYIVKIMHNISVYFQSLSCDRIVINRNLRAVNHKAPKPGPKAESNGIRLVNTCKGQNTVKRNSRLFRRKSIACRMIVFIHT